MQENLGLGAFTCVSGILRPTNSSHQLLRFKPPYLLQDLELAGVPVNDQLRQILKEENRRAFRQAAETDGKKSKGPRQRGWQMPAPDNREVHKLLKVRDTRCGSGLWA